MHGMIQGLDKMVSGSKKVPWHFNVTDSTVRDGLMTKEEARRESGLTWEPLAVNAYYSAGNDLYFPLPNHKLVVRDDLTTDDPNRVLGVVGSNYSVMGNELMFDVLAAMCDNGAKFDTAGSIRGGRRVYACCKLNETGQVKDDKTELYLLVTTAHDGSGGFEVLITPVRAVCNNTITLARANSLPSRRTLRHTKNAKQRLIEVARVIGDASKYFSTHTEIMNHLADVQIDHAQADRFIKKILGDGEAKQTDDARNAVMSLFNGRMIGADQEAVKGTVYGLVNAFTQWIETDKTVRCHNGRDESEVRFDSVIFGNGPKSGAGLRNSVMNEALTLI